MLLNIIDNKLVNYFYKFYKKDIRTQSEISVDEIQNLISNEFAKILESNNASNYLIEKFSDYDFSFMHILAKFGKASELKEAINLIDHSLININIDVNNYSMLHHASISGNLENVKILVGYGANINCRSSDETRNWTPIHYACKFNHVKIVDYLIGCGVNKEIKTSFELTPLHIACEYSSIEVIEYLISLNCNLNAISSFENYNLAPIHYCVMAKNLDSVKYLISNGANIFKKNAINETPIEMACKRGFVDIFKYLLTFGYDNLENLKNYALSVNQSKLLIIINDYIELRDKLFNVDNIKIYSNQLINEMNFINPSNFLKIEINVMDNLKVSPYFFIKTNKNIGILLRKNFTFRKFLEKNNFIIFANNIKKIEQIALYLDLNRVYNHN